jgi:hypothetical protein
MDSALSRSLGRATGWEDTLKTNALLADIFDMLQAIHADICALGGRKVHIKPYPRPGKDKDKKRIGKGALPYDQLREWIKERQGYGRR